MPPAGDARHNTLGQLRARISLTQQTRHRRDDESKDDRDTGPRHERPIGPEGVGHGTADEAMPCQSSRPRLGSPDSCPTKREVVRFVVTWTNSMQGTWQLSIRTTPGQPDSSKRERSASRYPRLPSHASPGANDWQVESLPEPYNWCDRNFVGAVTVARSRISHALICRGSPARDLGDPTRWAPVTAAASCAEGRVRPSDSPPGNSRPGSGEAAEFATLRGRSPSVSRTTGRGPIVGIWSGSLELPHTCRVNPGAR